MITEDHPDYLACLTAWHRDPHSGPFEQFAARWEREHSPERERARRLVLLQALNRRDTQTSEQANR